MRLTRVWHPIWAWEEMTTPMWEPAGGYDIQTAIDFTGDHILYGQAMARVVDEWPISCENSLTNYRINRKAWIGHAAAALAIGSPEAVTRKAWGMLSEDQRTLANREAARHIARWEVNYCESRGLCRDVAIPMLF